MGLVYDPFLAAIRWTWSPGAGIDMSGGTISVIDVPEGVPYIAGTGIGINGATITNTLAGSGRIDVAGGTASFGVTADIVTVTGASVTLQPDTAYKIYATSQAITLNANPPAAGKWAYDGHIELFVAGTGYVQTGSNVVLANALEPDAVNNCTVRFHDGYAIISVEDHVAGYIVVSASGSTSGTLPYALTSATQEYVAFDASLNSQALDMGGAATNGEKHVVGNGYTETIVSGGISCTSKTTFANLGMDGVVVSSGTLTMGDVYIPNGATVSVSGGGLEVKKVTGNGGVIDLGGTNVNVSSGGKAYVSGCTFSGGGYSTVFGGAMRTEKGGTISAFNCTFTGNVASRGGGIEAFGSNAHVALVDCIVSGNTAQSTSRGPDIFISNDATCLVYGGTYGIVTVNGNGNVNFMGSVKIYRVASAGGSGGSGTVTISSGAILDLTGNTFTTPINPGDGVTFAEGGATVYPFAGSASAYMLGGMTVPQIGNTNVVNLGGTVVRAGTLTTASGCTFTSGGSGANGAFYIASGHSANFVSCDFNHNSASNYGAAIRVQNGGEVSLFACTIEDNQADFGALYLAQGVTANLVSCTLANPVRDIFFDGNGAILNLTDCTFGVARFAKSATLNLVGANKLNLVDHTDTGAGSVVISSGASISLTGNTNATPIAPGGGITISSGGISIIDSAGSTHEFQRLAITGSTINNLGQIFGATVYVPVSSGGLGPWNIETTLGTSTVSATAAAQELVIEGGLVNIEEL